MENYDSYYNGIIISESALDRNGLISFNPNYLILATPHREIDGIRLITHGYNYVPNIDSVNYLTKIGEDYELYLPTPERAIIDNIRYESLCEEGVLVEAIYNYVHNNPDLSKLYEVADFYKVSRNVVDDWIKESEDWTGA